LNIKSQAEDRHKLEEVPTRIEPCFFEEGVPAFILSLVGQIQYESATLGDGLPSNVISGLADVVRIANSFHSNLIEGHHADPEGISGALEGKDGVSDYAREAASHVLVQREIDALHSQGDLPIPTSLDFVRRTHRRFYEGIPTEFGFVHGLSGERFPIVPGAFRADGDPDVVVGRHQPPSSHRVDAFMDHFARRYKSVAAGPVGRVIAIAAAHHRFNYIHPFPDGNGRVSRLMSHAIALSAGIEGNGLWSVSRGLSVGIKDPSEYKRHMDHADHPRMGDRDGRGNLSLNALATFCEWFLSTVIEQIKFSKGLFALEVLEARYLQLVSSVVAEEEAGKVISAHIRGGKADADLRLVHKLESAGFISSNGAVSELRFPVEFHETLFPGLMSAP
jgi:Fic family protein